MQEVIGRIKENKEIAKSCFRMVLAIESKPELRPGQFVNLSVDGKFLRRPISLCDVREDGQGVDITLVYKVVGEGTKILAEMQEGKEINLLVELGNGYEMELAGEKPLLIGGGAGVPPMYYLAKELRKKDARVTVILGFNSQDEVVFPEEFRELGCEVRITTVDGSLGTKGFVTDAIGEDDYTYFYACGPEPMLRALNNSLSIPGEMSFETRMGCGFGACMGCSCKTKEGHKRLCKEGPVLKKEEVLWED